MPVPSKDEVVKMATLRRQGHSVQSIAREMSFHRQTVSKHLKKFTGEQGAIVTEQGSGPPVPGRQNKLIDSLDIDGSLEVVMNRPISPDEMLAMAGMDEKLWIPTHWRPKTWQGSGKLKVTAPDGTVTETLEKIPLFGSHASFKRLLGEHEQSALEEFVRKAVKPLPKPSKSELKKRRSSADGQMLSWGLWDTHIGAYAWRHEVGEDYDVGIAARRICNSIDDMIEELQGYPIEKILMPVGNDYMHYDNMKMETTAGTPLDCDSRYTKVYLTGIHCLVYMIERALEICDNIEILYIPGNHDTNSSFGVCVALDQRFNDDPRVSADLSMNPRKLRTHGGTLIAFDHGQNVKATSYPLVLASEAKELWATSTWREVQIGHTHQRKETMFHGVVPVNGVLVRTNPSLCNIDAWHHSKGFLGEPLKSAEAWRYDRTGYRGSHVVFARDEERA